MKIFNVLTKKEFPVDGEMKQIWNEVGIIKLTRQGRMYLHLHMHPNVDYYLYESENNGKEIPVIPFDDMEDNQSNGA